MTKYLLAVYYGDILGDMATATVILMGLWGYAHCIADLVIKKLEKRYTEKEKPK
jgi:hypothetical protein